MFNIFVSSTCEDLKSYREQVRELITALGFVDIAMERWPPSSRPPKHKIEEAIEKSDVYVGLFAWRYGGRIEESGISYTEYEYQLAQEKEIPRLIFLVHPDKNWPVKYVDIGEDGDSIRALRKEIEEDKNITWKYFDSEIYLVRWLSAALFRLVANTRKYKHLDEEQKAIFSLRQIINDDLIARRNQIEYGEDESAKEWFINQIERCNVGRFYIHRDCVRKDIANWLLTEQSPSLFLVGPAGIGKTNFLISEIIHHVVTHKDKCSLLPEVAILLYLGYYDAEKNFQDNLKFYLHSAHKILKEISISTFINLINKGKALLILDGLDEFVRNKGEDKCHSLFTSLQTGIDLQNTRLVISCRNHIYKRLRKKNIFKFLNQEVVTIPPLTPKEGSEKEIQDTLLQHQINH